MEEKSTNNTNSISFKHTESYPRLKQLQKELAATGLHELFQNYQSKGNNRFQAFHAQTSGIFLDYSKQRINEEVLEKLINLAEKVGLKSHIDDFFSGVKLNRTEKRAVLHTALRSFSKEPLMVDDEDVRVAINRVREQMRDFVKKVEQKKILGFKKQPFKDVVNIGIGGSYLGPKLAVDALQNYHGNLRVHFISNIDGTDLTQVLKSLNPETTLFLIASKTFTTDETMTNARSARKWIIDHFNDDEATGSHFVALSTNHQEMNKFGINEEFRFEFWDFVGGRFSVWSAIGLSVALAVGYERFEEFLKGGEAMDQHFQNAPFDQNLPVLLALLTFWQIEFWGTNNYVNLPYAQSLMEFPKFLQQLDMESNGKSTTIDGKQIDFQTAPITWGEIGTNSQHSFFQLLHQGRCSTVIDFIGVKIPHHDREEHHEKLFANLLAQSQALAFGIQEEKMIDQMKKEGRSEEEIEELLLHRKFSGNRPSNTLIIEELTPYNLGQLIALYEHRTTVLGAIWGINSYDQWGVELGKIYAKNILSLIDQGREGIMDASNIDDSTSGMLNQFLD